MNLAREREISFQREVFPGIGTDGGALSLGGRGIPTGVLSIPSRYAHSPVEVIDMGDLQATVDLFALVYRIVIRTFIIYIFIGGET